MPKVCIKEECYNFVFGGGYCKYHQHLRTDKKKRQEKARSRINPISDRMKEEYKKYRPLRDKYMKEHPFCEVEGCFTVSQDLHHKAGRGKNLSNPDTFMAVCRKHHNFIHENPKKARALGYLI